MILQNNIKNKLFVASSVNFLKVLLLALILSVGISYVFAVGAPAANPPTCPPELDACNSPVHTGLRLQTKTGDLWVNGVLGANSNAFVNGRLGIGIGAGSLPDTNLDLAGTFKFRANPVSDPAGAPGAGKVLTSTDSFGNAKWLAPVTSSDTNNLMIKIGVDSTPMSCGAGTSACVKDVTFPVAFPIGMTPSVVTAQPKWTRDNSSEHSTWRVTDITRNGFKFTMTQPHDNSAAGGENGVMWSAYADATTYNASTLSTASCRSTYGNTGATTQRVIWWGSAPNAYGSATAYNATTGGYLAGANPPQSTNSNFPIVPDDLNITPARTVTRSFIIKDNKDTVNGVTVTCSVVIPKP